MKHQWLLCLPMGLFLASICGAEFQVNTHTANDQKSAGIAMTRGGDFVVVWSSYLQDGSSNGVFAQRFDPNCNPLGEELQINTTTVGNQTEPAVAMDAAAGFVVAWQGPGLIDAGEDIFLRRFDPNGSPLGDEFCAGYAPDAQICPSVALNTDGSFAVVWESVNLPQPGDRSICARLYDSNGVEIGEELVISDAPAVCRYPDIAADPNGNLAVAWMEDASSNSVMARLFNADGSARGDAFEVSTIHFSSLTNPSIAMDDMGFFVVAWDGDPKLAGQDDIHARLFDPNGTPLGEQFIVNTALDGAQQYPQAAMSGLGDFVIVWESRTTDPNADGTRDIFGQRFDNLAQPLGDEFRVNTFVEGEQRNAAVGMSDDGHFVAVWQSDGQDGSRFGIFAETVPKPDPADPNDDGS
ncbi:MAG TPA: hypothetical protein VMW24_10500 [Sedimentisphaerales bacterium]|nr:hypothetical protein [Sedimentisphaerales bacterium]